MKRLTASIVLLFTLLLAVGVAANDRVEGMSERVFKVLNDAQLMIEAEDYPAARAALEDALQRNLSDYEHAHILNMIGYTWYEQDDLARARDAYAEALELPEIPDSMLVTLRMTLGQVNLVMEEYVDAEVHLRALLALPDQNLGSNQVLLAAALVGQQRHADALEPLTAAIESEDALGNLPRENWLSMLASVHYELDDFVAMRDVVERLATHYPREQYLMNLAALHGQLGDSGRQLALVESLLDDQRLQQPNHILTIVNLYLAENLPYQAASLLAAEIDGGRIEPTVRNLELLSQAWYMSAELDRAIPPLAEAAALSESGELYLRLARLHMDAYRWDQASDAARAALDKGGLRQEGHAWLLRGMAGVRLKIYGEARRGFLEAANFDYTENYARQWLSYVDSEEQRSANDGS